MKRILCFFIVTVLLCAETFSVSALSFGRPEEYSVFDENILNLISEKYIPEDDSCAIHSWYYKQIYRYYNVNEESINEADADYVLVETYTTGDPMEYVKYIGKYVIVANKYGYPDLLSYYIYVPEINEVYTLEEAYTKRIAGIDNVFSESGIRAAIIGDSDGNGILNVKDATVIQKKLAGYDIKSYYDSTVEFLVDDFNRDDNCNIKDASAIQKNLAGISN